MSLRHLWSLRFVLAAASTASVAASEQEAVLAAGTEILFETVAPLSSKTAVKGDLIVLRTTENVRVGEAIVIPKGTTATGQVADARSTGGLGVSGKLVLRPLFLTLGDRTVRLSGRISDKGEVGPDTVIGIALVTSLISGKSAKLPAGTPVAGYVERSTSVSVPRLP